MSTAQEVKHRVTEKMDHAIEHLKRDLAGIRTGRASVALLDGIKVDYYGTLTLLKQVANVAAGSPPYHDSTVGTEPDPGSRKGDSNVRPGTDALERRQNDPHSPSSADRRAPQRISLRSVKSTAKK